eukprot:TRINITY_DN5990_c0_g1_i2.p1 TRINITY_DN5990_c0_g1~~TRINITY_DN5990_c0_g1_i2.p1  ORF type:complete len:1203 (+),score=204.53 TRINITY_DN5990_c0_g1_i2:24-3632(+)
MTNLVVPTFVWYGPPEHYISSILYLPEKSLVITGCLNGHVCIWDVIKSDGEGSTAKIVPRIFMTSLEPSPVIALMLTTYDWKESIVSVTVDGTVAICSLVDGQCLATTRSAAFKCEPTSVLLVGGNYLIAGGRTTELEIMDINVRKVLKRNEGHQTWIRDMVHTKIEEDIPVLVTLTGAGIVRFWLMTELLAQPKSATVGQPVDEHRADIYPIRQLHLELADAKSMAVSADNEVLLVVGGKKWILYTVKGSRMLMEIDLPKHQTAIKGFFISNSRIAIWTKSGHVILYDLPTQIKDEVKAENEMDIAYENSNVVVQTSNTTLRELKPIVTVRIKVPTTVDLNSKKKTKQLVGVVKITSVNNHLVVGFEDGTLGIWDLPIGTSSQDSDTSKSILIGAGKFSACWDNLNNDVTKKVPTCPVTASYLVEQELVLVNGYLNGEMSLRKLPFDPDTYVWKAHDSRINCLMSIKTHTDTVIISGSDDFYLKVWSLKTQSLLHRFSFHAGHVRDLFYPWKKGIPHIWKNRFFSVGDDNSVILHQLDTDGGVRRVFGPHNAEIIDVRWQWEQDYLIVCCSDGSVSIWEMESGELEQCLYGKTAIDILSNANSLAKLERQDKVKMINKKSISGITLDGYHVGRNSSPIQSIIFNIKYLSNELQQQITESENNPSSPSTNASRITSISSTNPETVSTSTLSSSTSSIKKSDSSLRGQTISSDTTDDQSPSKANSAYRAFSYLVPWGFDKSLDSIMLTQMLLKEPLPNVCFGLMGASGRMSILCPSSNIDSRRWTTSPTLTALHTLSTATLSKVLLSLGNNANGCSQILSHVCALIPENTSGYLDPSLSFLARYWQDQMDDVMQSARSIFISAIDRLNLAARQKLAAEWTTLLKSKEESDNGRKTKSLAVLVLGILGSERPDSLTADVSNLVTEAIMDLLFKENSAKLRVAAVELLGKGFSAWSKHIDNVSEVILKLFKLSILQEPKSLTTTAHHALMLIGSREPTLFIKSLTGKVTNKSQKGGPEVNPVENANVLNSIGALVKRNPTSLLPALPLLAESVVNSLDPHVPYLRNACLKAATTLVHELVRKYPMIAFHQQSQRLAVGTKEGTILIYDLISATRWFVLEGHKSEVSAVAFENEGDYLVSYSITDAFVKVWKTSASFFGILGSTPSCSKTINVSRTTSMYRPIIATFIKPIFQQTDNLIRLLLIHS